MIFFNWKNWVQGKKNHFGSVRAEKATGEYTFGYLDLMSRVRGGPAGERWGRSTFWEGRKVQEKAACLGTWGSLGSWWGWPAWREDRRKEWGKRYPGESVEDCSHQEPTPSSLKEKIPPGAQGLQGSLHPLRESGLTFSQDWIETSHRSETRIWVPVLLATSCLNLINQVVYLLRLELFIFTTEIVIIVTYRCWKV